MRWWPPSERQGQNSKSELNYLKEGMGRRENGWRGLKERCKGLKGSGAFLHQDDDEDHHEPTATTCTRIRQRGAQIIKRGLLRYVSMRQKAALSKHKRSRQRRFAMSDSVTNIHIQYQPPSAIMADPATKVHLYHPQPVKFHHTAPRSRPRPEPRSKHLPTPRLRDVYRPAYIPAASEMEIWILELWKDFLLEPTPYLVISASLYLGIFILFIQYYPTIWNIAYFFIQLIPWDEDFGTPGRHF
jgi:hypothetical protein